MLDFRLTLKNYRCFRQEVPVIVEIRKGFTALVGPNNSGKSTILRFTQEMKELWANIRPRTGGFAAALGGGQVGVNYTDVSDPLELFCNSNSGGLSFKLELLEIEERAPGIETITGVSGFANRAEPKNWRCVFLVGAEYIEIPMVSPGRNEPRFVDEPRSGTVVWGDKGYDYTSINELLLQLQNRLYIPPFRNAINEGSGTYYGMQIGSSFVATWDSWKNGGSVTQANAIEDVTENLRSVFSFDKLEINASSDRKELRVSIDGRPYRLAELGSGLAQFIIIFGNAAIMRPSLILIDEPEINLHPSLQIAFLLALARYADGNIVFATHSIGLARATAESFYSFRLDSGRVPTVSRFEQTPNYAEFVGEMSFSAFKELGCGAILLVEGVTDVKTFQQFLRKIKKDASVVVIPLGGSAMVCGGREIELEEIKRITPKVFAVVDSERNGKGKPPIQVREEFRKSCEALNIEVHLTKRRATENYFTDEAVKAVLGDKASALGDFESLKDSCQSWSKSHYNWQIASRMTREDIESTDIGKFLSKLLEDDG